MSVLQSKDFPNGTSMELLQMNLRQLRMERFFEPSFEVSLKSNRLK